MSSHNTLDLRTTTAVLGLTTSIYLAGINFDASNHTLPILYRLPAIQSTNIFTELFLRGKALIMPLTFLSVGASAAAAYLSTPETGRSGFATTAVLTLSTGAWTQFMMVNSINRLMAIDEELNVQGKDEKESTRKEVDELLRGWAWKNFVRSSMSLAGGLVGLLTLLDVL